MPIESKEIFSKKNIIPLYSNPKFPLFNCEMFYLTSYVDDKKSLVVEQEILEMLINQSSLKTLVYNNYSNSLYENYFLNLPFTTYPEAVCHFGNLSAIQIFLLGFFNNYLKCVTKYRCLR